MKYEASKLELTGYWILKLEAPWLVRLIARYQSYSQWTTCWSDVVRQLSSAERHPPAQFFLNSNKSDDVFTVSIISYRSLITCCLHGQNFDIDLYFDVRSSAVSVRDCYRLITINEQWVYILQIVNCKLTTGIQVKSDQFILTCVNES